MASDQRPDPTLVITCLDGTLTVVPLQSGYMFTLLPPQSPCILISLMFGYTYLTHDSYYTHGPFRLGPLPI